MKGLGQQANSPEKRILLIAGGEGKGQDFSPLADAVERYAKKVFLIGKAKQEIRQVLTMTNVECEDFADLDSAVQAAAEFAKSGDIVLLSPACASLDMFRNYAHRAEVFVDAVREVALSKGEIC